MAAPKSILRVYQSEQVLTFQVEGWATMAQSMPIRRRMERGLALGLTTLRVDLRHCTYMDSTFMGTLLFLKRSLAGREGGDFALVCPSPECDQLLQKMGMEGLFCTVTAEESAATTWTEIGSEGEDIQTAQRNVVQAHLELASLPGPAGEPFRTVARCLAEAEKAER
jgi:anti-anti-sigma factor